MTTAVHEKAALGDDFVAACERALDAGRPDEVSDADLTRVMTAAVRLYAAKRDGGESAGEPVQAEKITPTEIVVTVSDLIRAAGLNLWDVSMWFNRSGR
jgi:hypothetical protein